MQLSRLQFLFALAFASSLAYAQPTITSILDPYTSGTKLTPGGLAVITGTGFGPNATAAFGGKNAFTLVPPQNSNKFIVEIPVDAPLGDSIAVTVSSLGATSTAINIPLVQYAPVLIAAGNGALTSPRHNSTNVGINAGTPAVAGEVIVFYGIGLGPTTNTPVTGALAQSNPAASTTTAATVSLAGSNGNGLAHLASSQGFFGANAPGGLSGSASALVGVFVITTTIPQATAPGTYPMTVTIGGVTSNSINVIVAASAPTIPVISAVVGESGRSALCPGDVVILSGINFGDTATVSVGGKPAAIISQPGSKNQMTIQLPVDAPTGTNVFNVITNGQTSPNFTLTLGQFAPAFLPGANGTPLLPFHLNNTAVTNASPAYPGERIYMLAYGLGATKPVVPTGQTPSDSSAATTTLVTVNFGATTITDASSSLSTGQVGVYYVSFVVPAGLASSAYPTQLSIGGAITGLVNTQVFNGPIISDISNAASNIASALPNGPIAQGAIFVLKGNGLGPATLSVATNAFQSSNLSGTSVAVTVNGTQVAGLMYYTSSTQVAALLPSNTPVGTGTLTVSYNGLAGLSFPITVVKSNIGIFTVTSDGQGVGIVTYPDYSLVSVTKAANCGGPYTTCGAANPGDVLTVWATGLGPVNGSDAAGAGIGVDMPGIDLKLWIGGVSAQILFKGRGCCIGEDQIAFTVPDNVPTGCAVPLAMQIGNQISNYTVVAIAPKGTRTCKPSDPSFPASAIPLITTGTAPINLGQFSLNRFPNQNAQGTVSATTSTDYMNAVFLSFTVPAALQPFMLSYLDKVPPGTCTVYNVLNPSDGSDRLTNFTPLDAGPTVKVTGPNGTQNVTPNGDDSIVASGNFLSPGNYTFTGTSGANVGAFSAPYTIPALSVLTSPPSGPNVIVNRANGITLNWTPGGANSLIDVTGGDATDNNGNAGASFICSVSGSAGTLTIPPSVLLAIPPGTFRNSVWNFTSRSFGAFTAPGLNFAIVQTKHSTPIFTTFQ